MKKLVFGRRPEAIRMCPFVNELKSRPDDFETVVCVAGQHREVLDQMLRAFDIAPDYDPPIMRPGQSFFDVVRVVLSKIKSVLEAERSDCVIVRGDTTETSRGSWGSRRVQACGNGGECDPCSLIGTSEQPSRIWVMLYAFGLMAMDALASG